MCATNRAQRYKKNLKYANPYIIFLHIWKKSSIFAANFKKDNEKNPNFIYGINGVVRHELPQ